MAEISKINDLLPQDLATADKPRVLVVDDEAVIVDILQDFLTFEGFDITVANRAEVAIEVLKNHHYQFDAILSDLKMPGMGGLGLLRHLVDSGSDIFTVIMTGYGTVETAIEAMKTGAFDYVLKPFKPEEVVRVLRRGLEKQRLERENFDLRQSVGFYELSEALSGSMPLPDQLAMITEMVRDNLAADAVSIVVEDPHNPGHYNERAAIGPKDFQPRAQRLIEEFLRGAGIVAHGPNVTEWLSSGATAEYRVESFMAAPLRIRGAPLGFINAISFRRDQRFTEGQRKGLSIFGSRAASAVENSRMYDNIRNTFTQTIEGFARALEAKDNYTHGHSDRVAMYSRLIAETMGLDDTTCERIQHGGLMHDIGKIGIRSSDLNKPQKLTAEEYLMFKSHPVQGKRIIEPIGFLAHLVPCVYHHHESWDGSGYPEALDKKDIPFEARILAVADSYDAMTSNRPYRKAMPHIVALAEIKRCSGKQFDPEVVEAFLSAIDEFRAQRRTQDLAIPD